MGSIFCFLKGCTKCNGDLVFDDGDWRCWQCGQYYYANGVASPEELKDEVAQDHDGESAPGSSSDGSSEEIGHQEPRKRGRRRGYGARYARNIDAVIRAKQVSDERWWARNREIIGYLDQGLSVREVAKRSNRGDRQIRVVRERLYDLRAASAGSDVAR